MRLRSRIRIGLCFCTVDVFITRRVRALLVLLPRVYIICFPEGGVTAESNQDDPLAFIKRFHRSPAPHHENFFSLSQ